jgi:hypothetical protein
VVVRRGGSQNRPRRAGWEKCISVRFRHGSQQYEGVLFGTVRTIRRYRTVIMSNVPLALFDSIFQTSDSP